MRNFITRSPPADGGYPVDSDLHQMSDDGGPVGPDPARWSDPEWRDNLGELDTFAEESRTGPPAGATITVCRPASPVQQPPSRPPGARDVAADPGVLQQGGAWGNNGVSVRLNDEAMPGFSAAVGLRTAVTPSHAVEFQQRAEEAQVEEALSRRPTAWVVGS